MDQTPRSRLVPGLVVLAGGLLVTMAALERLRSPELRALGGRELLIMAGLLIVGGAVAILGGSEAAGSARVPTVVTTVLAWLAGMLAAIDVGRIVIDEFLTWWGDPGPLAAIPPPSNWAQFLGAGLCCTGGVLLGRARLGVFPGAAHTPEPSMTKTDDSAKTYHANRWWMRDGSGSVLIWDDQAQAWSPWVQSRDPELPPGWLEVISSDA